MRAWMAVLAAVVLAGCGSSAAVVGDAGSPDSGVPDSGTPDAGHDAGTPDAGGDAGQPCFPDGGCPAGTSCYWSTPVIGGATACEPLCDQSNDGGICPSGFWCQFHICSPMLDNSSECTASNQCQSLNCADAGSGYVCEPDAGP